MNASAFCNLFYAIKKLLYIEEKFKETLNKARLTALYAICLQIFRHIAQKSLAIRQYACGISMQSAEKSDYASYAQALFSVSLTVNILSSCSILTVPLYLSTVFSIFFNPYP